MLAAGLAVSGAGTLAVSGAGTLVVSGAGTLVVMAAALAMVAGGATPATVAAYSNLLIFIFFISRGFGRLFLLTK